jgi:hypothetical protein
MNEQEPTRGHYGAKLAERQPRRSGRNVPKFEMPGRRGQVRLDGMRAFRDANDITNRVEDRGVGERQAHAERGR